MNIQATLVCLMVILKFSEAITLMKMMVEAETKETHLKRPGCWEKIKGRRRGRQRMRWLDGITDLMDNEFE